MQANSAAALNDRGITSRALNVLHKLFPHHTITEIEDALREADILVEFKPKAPALKLEKFISVPLTQIDRHLQESREQYVAEMKPNGPTWDQWCAERTSYFIPGADGVDIEELEVQRDASGNVVFARKPE